MNDHQVSIASLLSVNPATLKLSPVAGGCISTAYHVQVQAELSKTIDYFVKVNSRTFLDNFEAEANGLKLMRQACASSKQRLTIPEPITVATVGDQAFLLMDWIETSRRKPRHFQEEFGHALATFHLASRGDRIGLEQDNFLGSAQQINSTKSSWIEFVAENRLNFQLKWAIQQSRATSTLKQDVETIIGKLLEILITEDTSTSLLHGDLWSGNYLCDSGGLPVLIDPAVYYGHREAEFGMLKLFGGCSPEFYEAYNSTWPLEEGWERRVQVYVLYHLLNHLNLFGSAYLSQCQTMARDILRS